VRHCGLNLGLHCAATNDDFSVLPGLASRVLGSLKQIYLVTPAAEKCPQYCDTMVSIT
jgi:hypothetical protein